jgi:hypothetical protein
MGAFPDYQVSHVFRQASVITDLFCRIVLVLSLVVVVSLVHQKPMSTEGNA